jgi:uncharacterized membrane protein
VPILYKLYDLLKMKAYNSLTIIHVKLTNMKFNFIHVIAGYISHKHNINDIRIE